MKTFKKQEKIDYERYAKIKNALENKETEPLTLGVIDILPGVLFDDNTTVDYRLGINPKEFGETSIIAEIYSPNGEHVATVDCGNDLENILDIELNNTYRLTLEPKIYTYACLHPRGIDPGCQPSNPLSTSLAFDCDKEKGYYGTISYARPLDKEDLIRYNLELITE